MPFRFTIRHYFPLGAMDAAFESVSLDTPEAWDAVRKSHPHFATPDTRDAWQASFKERRDGQDNNTPQRGKAVAHIMRTKGFTSLHSLGVGSAALEYFVLQEFPQMELTVSEYNDESVRLLRRVFPEANPIRFNILNSKWPDAPSNHLVMIYRMDPQLSDAEWHQAFARMHSSGVRTVLYIPSKFLTIKNLIQEWQICLRAILHRQRLSFAGYKRTQTVFESYWRDLYKTEMVDVGRLKGYLLTL